MLRTVLKVKWIFFTLWSKDRDFEKYKKIIIAVHWCPSHPFDHIPYHFEWFIEHGYILLFPNYYGTWGSDGQCDFDNCIDTITDLVDEITNTEIINTYDNTVIDLKNKEITIFGASFWWHVALCAGVLHPSIKNIIAFSPIIDWENHNKNNDEADLWDLKKRLEDSYSNLRRYTKTWLDNLAQWKMKYSAINLLEKFENKNILLVHWKKDPQVNREKSKNFMDQLQQSYQDKKYFFHWIEDKWHLLLHHCFDDVVKQYVMDFLS